MTTPTAPRAVSGHDGFRFVFRDAGQTIRPRDYAEITIARTTRGSGPHYPGVSRYKKETWLSNKKILQDTLKEFKAGKYIYADAFVKLCDDHDVKLREITRHQCQYINELDVSIRVLRHKSTRGTFMSKIFDSLFVAMQMLIINTMDVK